MRSGPCRAEAVNRPDRSLSLRAHLPSLALAIACFVAPFAGCVPAYYEDDFPRPRARSQEKVPLPRAALLSPQGPPDCGEGIAGDQRTAGSDPKRTTGAAVPDAVSAAMVPPGAAVDRDLELAARIKLEYERECYRQAEMRVRERLRQLQSSVGETIKAIDRTQ